MSYASNYRIGLSAVLLILLFLVSACTDHSTPEGGHGTPEADDYERGPHNGRLLRANDIALEITIFESGVPPEFRVYPYRNDQPIDPDLVELSIELGRLGDRVDRFEFSAQEDYLRGDGVVLEPHSFAVAVRASIDGRSHEWTYDSFEGRTEIDGSVAVAMGIEVTDAGPGTIRETLTLQGTIKPHPEAVVEVRGRFPGLVESLGKSVGDEVERGEVLARIQSNESLQTYTVTAPISGTVIERNAAVGSSSTDVPIYVVVDLSRLVADLKVFPQDVADVSVGQEVTITGLDSDVSFAGTIDRILPMIDPGSRAATARVTIDNADVGWRPGQFVEGTVTISEVEVPLVVRESGLQSFRDFTVVYARVEDTYEVRMLDLGRRDGEFVEVLGGLEPGTTYVSDNSYLIKADIEKSGASHDH